MANHGLFIGNNYPDTELRLRGCVNDALDWKKLLAPSSTTVQLLLDKDATRENMIETFTRVLHNLNREDWAIITYSGHGSWVPDEDDDESDGRDECLVPYDYHNLLLDDDIYDILTDRANGSHVLFITDSCHGGTVCRMMGLLGEEEALRGRIRFVDPAFLLRDEPERIQRAMLIAKQVREVKKRNLNGVIHMAGCQDYEYSYDAAFNGRANGAFTYAAIKALRKLDKTPAFRGWHRVIRRMLPSWNYPQTPRLNAGKREKRWGLPWAKKKG